MKLWKSPPRIKIYEALGCVADGRIRVRRCSAVVTSSSGKKKYQVLYDPKQNAIVANDNGAYWQGYVGYPAIAFLMKKRVLPYDRKIANSLKGVPWKDVNVKFKNDYRKSTIEIERQVKNQGADIKNLRAEVAKIFIALKSLKLQRLPFPSRPPKGF